VSWAINGFHTVSFLAKGQTPPPLIIPAIGNPISRQLDAASASFWFNGQPNQVINPVTASPSGGKTYKGSGFLNSGLPSPSGPPAPFVVKFTKAGTYTFNCLVHPGMKGVVQVLSKSKKVPTAAQDRATANAQEAAAIVQARTLGIYWGNPLVNREFNPRSFLNYPDFPNEEALVEKIIELDRDDAKYLEYLRQPYFHEDRPNEFFDRERLLSFFEKVFTQPIQPVSQRRKWFSPGRWTLVKRNRPTYS